MPPTNALPPSELSAIAGLILSLVLARFPGVKAWYTPLPNKNKFIVTSVLIALVAIGAMLYNCQGKFDCVAVSWQDDLAILIAALVANQSTYLLAVRPFKKSSQSA